MYEAIDGQIFIFTELNTSYSEELSIDKA
jgi:hypothetical protein